LQATDEKDKEGKSAAKKNKEGTQKSPKKVSKTMFWYTCECKLKCLGDKMEKQFRKVYT